MSKEHIGRDDRKKKEVYSFVLDAIYVGNKQSQPSLLHCMWTEYRPALEDLHQLKNDQMGKANECRRYLGYWNSVGNAIEKKEMEDRPSMYTVDAVERKKAEMFRGQ